MPNLLRAIRIFWIRRTSRNRAALRDLPPELFDHWANTAQREFAGIPRDAWFYMRAADALLTFFECVKRSKRKCALPSKAADSVWRAWLGHSRASLDAFCVRHYGQRIPYVEAGVQAGRSNGAMAACLVAARALDRVNPAGPDVPRLFATDGDLGMPHGFAFDVNGAWMVYRHLNRHGDPEGAEHVHPGTSPDYLYAARLIARPDFERWQTHSRGMSLGATPGSGLSGDDDSADDSDDALSCDSGSGSEGGSEGSSDAGNDRGD